MKTRRSTSVQIQGHEYRIRSEADPASVQRAARFVDETMDRIRDRTGTVDSLDVAVLTALNMANQLLTLRDGRTRRGGDLEGERVDPERVRSLIDQLEAAERAGGAGAP